MYVRDLLFVLLSGTYEFPLCVFFTSLRLSIFVYSCPSLCENHYCKKIFHAKTLQVLGKNHLVVSMRKYFSCMNVRRAKQGRLGTDRTCTLLVQRMHSMHWIFPCACGSLHTVSWGSSRAIATFSNFLKGEAYKIS